MFFSAPYEYPPCGVFSWGHLVLFVITAGAIAAGLVALRRAEAHTVRRVVRISTAVLWALEAAKIAFVLTCTSHTLNDFIPLYYCSIVLYAGALSSLGRGVWRRMGDTFLATGGIVGGASFLCFPSTSLPRYPLVHFISWHSFLLHGLMVFLGLLLLTRGVYRARLSDVRWCALLVTVVCAAAFAINLPTGANLMFISRDFPGTPVHLIFVLTGPLFPIVMWLGQAFLPFLSVFAVLRLCRRTEETSLVK